MSDAALNFVFLVISLLLAIVGGVVGAWLQHRSWMNQHWEKLRAEKIAFAQNAVQDVARLIDRRLYRQRRFLWAARKGPSTELDIATQDYRDVIFEWMDSLGRLKAEMWLSFDRRIAVRFEEEIHDEFASIGRSIERSVRMKRRDILNTEEDRLNQLGLYANQFVASLLQKIEREEIRGLQGRDRVSLDNWSNLTTGYLIRRLFGLPA